MEVYRQHQGSDCAIEQAKQKNKDIRNNNKPFLTKIL